MSEELRVGWNSSGKLLLGLQAQREGVLFPEPRNWGCMVEAGPTQGWVGSIEETATAQYATLKQKERERGR